MGRWKGRFTDKDGRSLTSNVNVGMIRNRLQRIREKDIRRLPTGYSELDEITKGLAFGANLIVGGEGGGKSRLCGGIAVRHNTLYVSAEDPFDSPNFPNVKWADFSDTPYPNDAVPEILYIVENAPELFGGGWEPDLLVVDSITQLLAETKKAVEEADIRGFLRLLGKQVRFKIPTLVVSEIRGGYGNEYPAGGRAVGHKGVMNIWVEKVEVKAKWDVDIYKQPIGTSLYTIKIMKDRERLAIQNQVFKFTYMNPQDLSSDIIIEKV